jgi:hypothetical protein
MFDVPTEKQNVHISGINYAVCCHALLVIRRYRGFRSLRSCNIKKLRLHVFALLSKPAEKPRLFNLRNL